MIGKTHTIRRIATGLALAAATAALTAPAGLAAGKPNYGPPDPWALPYLAASPAQFVTDTLNSARVERTQASVLAAGKPNYGPPDPWALPYLTASRGAFVTDTVNSARGVRASATGQLPAVVSSGFNWNSFAIGIGAGIGGLLVLGGIAAGSGKLRRLAHA